MAALPPASDDSIERIKRLAIVAIFSDDELVERFVLKGGNALALGYGLDTRVSSDLDFSMATAFDPQELNAIRDRITYRLEQTFRPEGWEPFDVIFKEKPKELSEDLADFWGGYSLDFKLIDAKKNRELRGDLSAMRRYAQATGPGDRKRLQVDISRHEQCDPKRAVEIEGYTVYVYTPLLLVCEKLRAICQQMVDYDPFVKRLRTSRTARPRDFLDVYTLLNHFPQEIDLSTATARELLGKVFAAKRVPIKFLNLIQESHDQHVTGWAAVKDTVRPDFDLQDFRFYFEFVVDLVAKLHPIGDV